ncbi:unnamed protein product [Urochloa humidicola]
MPNSRSIESPRASVRHALAACARSPCREPQTLPGIGSWPHHHRAASTAAVKAPQHLATRRSGQGHRVQHCIRARDGGSGGATQQVATVEIRVRQHPRRPPPGHGEQQGILLGMGNPLLDISSILDAAFIARQAVYVVFASIKILIFCRFRQPPRPHPCSVTTTADVDVKDGHTPMLMRCAPRMKQSMRILNEDESHDGRGWSKLEEPASSSQICRRASHAL